MLESFPVTAQPKLILASNSPRRRQLLALTGFDFDVIVSNIDETEHPNESPADYVLRLAETKARAIPAQPDQIVLAADTTVVDRDDILGKPADEAEAFAMLTRLRGHAHQVYTGVALLRKSDNLLLKELSVTDVPMRNYSDDEVQAYIVTGDPLDKAGAYAIQHSQFHPVAMPSVGHDGMSGCFASVMGLPLCHVVRMLRKMDIQPNADVPLKCQELLDYQCPVSEKILSGVM